MRARANAAMNGKEGETRTHASDLKNRREGRVDEKRARERRERTRLPSREAEERPDNGLARIQHTCTNVEDSRGFSSSSFFLIATGRRAFSQDRPRTIETRLRRSSPRANGDHS